MELLDFWKTNIFYINASVTKTLEGTVKKVIDSFTFNGKGVGAKWLVGKKAENQLRNFIDIVFTLLANITIDGDAGDKSNFVLGMDYKSNGNEEKNIGLFCTKESWWVITDNNESPKTKVTTGKKCQQGSTYLVALIFKNAKLSVYIDGEQLGGNGNGITIEQSANITHFCFGADGEIENAKSKNIESFVIVTNVLLYNRPLPEEVIKELKIFKDEKFKEKEKDTEMQNSSSNGTNTKGKETTKGGTDDKKGTSDQSNDTAVDNNNNNNNGEETLTSEDSTVRGGVVGVLLFLLLLLLTAYM